MTKMTQVDGTSRSPRAAGPLPLETFYWDPNLAHGIRTLGTGPRYNTNTATAAVTSSNCASQRRDIQSSTTGVEPLGTSSSSTSKDGTLGLFDINEGPATATDDFGACDTSPLHRDTDSRTRTRSSLFGKS